MIRVIYANFGKLQQAVEQHWWSPPLTYRLHIIIVIWTHAFKSYLSSNKVCVYYSGLHFLVFYIFFVCVCVQKKHLFFTLHTWELSLPTQNQNFLWSEKCPAEKCPTPDQSSCLAFPLTALRLGTGCSKRRHHTRRPCEKWGKCSTFYELVRQSRNSC